MRWKNKDLNWAQNNSKTCARGAEGGVGWELQGINKQKYIGPGRGVYY